MFENLGIKLKEPPAKNDDLQKAHDALKKERDGLKAQISKRDEADKLAAAKLETRKLVVGKVAEALKGFDFPSDQSKSTAIDTFINGNKFIQNDGDIYLDKAGSAVTDFTEQAKTHFALYGVPVDPKKKKDKNPPPPRS